MGGASSPIIKTKWSFFHSNLNEKTEFKKYIEIKQTQAIWVSFLQETSWEKEREISVRSSGKKQKTRTEKREQEEQGL